MTEIFLRRLETFIDLAKSKPWKEHDFATIQVYKSENDTLHAAGVIKYQEYQILNAFACMIQNAMRDELRKER